MNFNYTKKSTFTLVEVMISSAIGLIITLMLLTVSIQVYETNSDAMADMLLTRNSRILRQKLVKQFKLTQINWNDSHADEKDLNYRIISDDEDMPNPYISTKEAMRIKLQREKLIGINYFQGTEKDLTQNNIYIEDLKIKKVDDDSLTGFMSLKKIEMTYLLRLDYCGNSYYREESLVAPIVN